MDLTHINEMGEAHMVDVGEKPVTKRTATAHGKITMQAETLQRIRENAIQKGDVLSVARIAGIQAAKRTDTLIPLCHSLPLSQVDIQFSFSTCAVEIEATTVCHYQTGVEMEAFTAVSVAALTIYDMCKAIDRGMEIGEIYLLEKTGGRSGTYRHKKESSHA